MVMVLAGLGDRGDIQFFLVSKIGYVDCCLSVTTSLLFPINHVPPILLG